MSYSTDLTDTEWEIIEPILHQILPIKKATLPPNWTKIEILNGRLYQLNKANLSDDSGWIEMWNLSVTGKPRSPAQKSFVRGDRAPSNSR